MDLSRRLSKAVMVYELNRAVYDKPDINNMSGKEITQQIIRTLERNHIDDNIKTLDQAISFINRMPDEILSSKDRKLMITTEKNYFSGEYEKILNELEASGR